MIEYNPKEFHEVKLGYFEQGENSCTPYYPDTWAVKNQVAINSPKTITYIDEDNCTTIPLCGIYMIPERRGLKYAHLSTPIIHVKKENEETWQTGEIIDPKKKSNFSTERPESEEEEAKRQQAIKDAQKYSDDQLYPKEGSSSGSTFNVNLVEYINMLFEAGIYELYVSMFGLESNRVKVEIIIKEESDKKQNFNEPLKQTPTQPPIQAPVPPQVPQTPIQPEIYDEISI